MARGILTVKGIGPKQTGKLCLCIWQQCGHQLEKGNFVDGPSRLGAEHCGFGDGGFGGRFFLVVVVVNQT